MAKKGDMITVFIKSPVNQPINTMTLIVGGKTVYLSQPLYLPYKEWCSQRQEEFEAQGRNAIVHEAGNECWLDAESLIDTSEEKHRSDCAGVYK